MKALDTMELVNQNDPMVTISGDDDQTCVVLVVRRPPGVVGWLQTQQLAERDAEPDLTTHVHQSQEYRPTPVRQSVYKTHLCHFLTDTGREGQPFYAEPKNEHRQRIFRLILVFRLGECFRPVAQIVC